MTSPISSGSARFFLATAVVGLLPMMSAVAGPFFYLPNGNGGWNAYEVENTAVTQSAAFTAAAGRTFPGAGSVGANPSATGSVVTVRSAEQNTILNTVRNTNFGGSTMWLGLTDDPALVPGAIEGGNTSGNPLPAPGQVPVSGERGYGYVWQSGDAFTYQNWGGGEPNNFGSGENAVEMTAAGTWNDNIGTLTHQYLVEYKLNLASAPAFLPGNAGGFGTFAVDVRRGAGSLFTIRDAEAAFRTGAGTLSSGFLNTINLNDPEDAGGPGKFGTANRTAFPGNLPAAEDDFAVLAHGTIRITSEGDYTFGFSGDDGSSLRILGANFISKTGGGYAAGDTLQFEGPTGDSNTLGVTHLLPGDYPLEYSFFERGGGAFTELYAGSGVITDRASTSLVLIGDTANGGLPLVPEPTSVGLLAFGALGLLGARRRRRD